MQILKLENWFRVCETYVSALVGLISRSFCLYKHFVWCLGKNRALK